jgi:DNA-binding MarR family transcriptional regulator
MMSIDLDLFVLAMVQSGLGTTYDLKSKAGLSVGSTSPILARLEQAGLLEAPKAERDRGVRRFSISKEGKKHLAAGWKELLQRRPTDIDEILRITYIAWTMGSADVASRFIETAAAGLQDLAVTRRAEANQLLRGLTGPLGGQAFRWLRTGADAARIEAQAEALKQLGREIKVRKSKRK